MSTTEPARFLPESLGERLSRARRHAHLDQDEMANALGVSRSLVTKFEHNARDVRTAYLKEWARQCGVDYEWLISGTSNDSGSSCPGEEVLQLAVGT